MQVSQNCDCKQRVLIDFNCTYQRSNQEHFKVILSLTVPILAMHLIGNSTCLRGAIQDHYGPLVSIIICVLECGCVLKVKDT